MANYIGNQPSNGQFRKLDTLAFDGTTTTFNLSAGGTTFVVGSATQLMVSLNGVMQEPYSSYNVVNGGTQIEFSTPPAASTPFFGVALSGLGDESTPADGTVTTVKIADGAITADKIADGTIIASDIADGTVTPTKLDREYATKGTSIALSIALG